MTPDEIAREAIFRAKQRYPKSQKVCFFTAQRCVGLDKTAVEAVAWELWRQAKDDREARLDTADYDDTLAVITEMIERVRFPAGQRLAHILARAEEMPVVPYMEPRASLLVRCCQAAAAPSGKLFLSYRDIGTLLKVSHVSAYHWMSKIIRYGYVHKIWSGHSGRPGQRGRANEYTLTEMGLDA